MNRFQKDTIKLMEHEKYAGKFTNMSIRDNSNHNSYTNATIFVSTHRLMIESTHNSTLSLKLSLVTKIQAHHVNKNITQVQVHLNQADSQSQFGSDYTVIMIDYNKHKSGNFKEVLENTFKKSIWKQYPFPNKSFPPITHVGIGGIERAKNEQFKEDNQAISAAFSDLKNLIELASKMTKLSHNLSTKLAAKTTSSGSSSLIPDEVESTVIFRSILMSAGIDNPVTRGGSNYHRELARQLYDFLLPLVHQVGGVMALTEAFCYFNRARSLSLISPQDMVSAVNCFNDISDGKLLFRKFQSGCAVLMLESFEDEFVVEDFRLGGPLTVEGYSTLKKIPVFLARERLSRAEDEGTICRDESVEGVIYYWNIF